MPRYFFHLHCGEVTVPDQSGSDLADPDRAFEAAQATARDLMRTKLETEVDWLACRFEVTDAAGEVVFEFPFTEAVEVPRPPS